MTEINYRAKKEAARQYHFVLWVTKQAWRERREREKVPEDWRTAAADSPAGKKFREELIRRARERAATRR
jgi:hypothetical protein